ncbi:MAG: hypothetical protein MUF36_05840 [Bacteroidales bacterium]|jgi:hypothetical protein|nr:hypothetical protein [Bacteroidales bacterium]
MLKKVIFLFLVFLAGCTNQKAPKEVPVTTDPDAKSLAAPPKPAPSPWTTSSYAPKEGESEGRKFVRFVTNGNFTNKTQTNGYLYAEVIVDKKSAGIFLHEFNKSNPAEKFSKPVQINMVNSQGEKLQMTSARSWNSSGGISIERNNNDYSQFRIFLLKSKGTVTVEIKDSGNKNYHFSINTDGFSDSFTKL